MLLVWCLVRKGFWGSLWLISQHQKAPILMIVIDDG